jgi:hypothetical protein
MDTRTRWLAVMAALAAVAGCAEGPSAGVLQTARVFPANYRAELVAYLRNFLNDPTGVRNAYLSEPALMRLQGEERYVTCVRFDAKNSYGGYRGSRDHLATYFGGKLEYFVELRPEAGDERCKAATYGPFPELEKLTRR